METLGKITLSILLIVSSFFVSLLGAYVILQISYLYDLKFISDLPFINVYGITCIISIVMYRQREKKESSKSYNDTLKETGINILNYMFHYLSCWVLAYIMYLIIK